MNIIFNSIYIYNFFSIHEAQVQLNDQGFVSVIGKNNQPVIPQSNGSGKSSIFDAIFWTLTGDTLRGTSDVVNENGVKDGCECVLEFTDGKSFYKIKRAKGHISLGNTCLFYVDGELVSDQTKKSQEMIEKHLPLVVSPEILGSIILLGQGLPYKFSSFTPIKRKDMLELMSGADTEIDEFKNRLSVKEKQICQINSQVSSKINELSSKISSDTQLIESLKKQIASYEDKDISEEIRRLKSEIFQNQESLKDFSEKEELSEELSQVEILLNQTIQMIYQIQASKTAASQQLSSMNSGVCPTCGRPYEISNDQIKLKESLTQKLSEYDITLSTLNTKKTKLETRKFEITEEINLRKNTTSTLNYKISECKARLEEYQRYQSIIDDLQNQINELEYRIKTNQAEVQKFSEDLKRSNNQIDCISYINRQLSRDFKGYMLQEAIDFMSQKAKEYGHYLFTDKEINIKLNGNKINILVGDRQYENLSGGERQRADLAVQFALRDMLSVSSGFNCNLLVLDEAFDNLDAQGSEALVALITSEFSDVDSVFIITHHSEIDLPYDYQITVTKEKDGNSYIN